jgi:hypothetical protein
MLLYDLAGLQVFGYLGNADSMFVHDIRIYIAPQQARLDERIGCWNPNLGSLEFTA